MARVLVEEYKYNQSDIELEFSIKMGRATKRADIVVFNPETVIDNATFEDPHQIPSGIEYVIVNGELTIRNGKHTGAKAGTILRHIS